ncbi:Gfa family protein [Pleurotus pulmonarius]
MPVELKGSCHCGAVRFSLMSSTPVPYQLCLCSICRKVDGKENISVYKAIMDRDTPKERVASSERSFCSKCSAMLWLYDETWPELIHPFASAIDEPELQSPETLTCLMLNSKPDYVRLPEGARKDYKNYPRQSLEEWHKTNGLYVE